MLFGNLLCFGILKLTSLFSSSCTSRACRRTENFLKMSMSTDETKVCDSFQEYVCENFKKNFPLQPYETTMDMGWLRKKEIDKLVLGVLNGRKKGIEAVQKARTYYKSCLNSENSDLSSLEEELSVVGLEFRPPFDAPEPKELVDISEKVSGIRGTLFSFLIKFGVQQDWKKTNKFLPLVDNTPEMATHVYKKDETVRNALRNYMFNVVTYMYRKTATTPKVDNEHILQRIDEVINFLTKIQQTTELDNLSHDFKTYLSLSDLQSKTDNLLEGKPIKLNWTYLIQHLVGDDMMIHFQNGEPVAVNSEEQLMNVIKAISETKPEVFDAALWWVIVEEYNRKINTKELKEFKIEFERSSPSYAPIPRNEYCISDIFLRFSQFVGYILTTQPDSFHNRDKIIDMVMKLIDELNDLVKKPTWLSEESKSKLLEKIDELLVIPSFQDELADPDHINKLYQNYKFSEDDYYSNRIQFVQRNIMGEYLILRSSLRSLERKITMPEVQEKPSDNVSLPPTRTSPAYFTLNHAIALPIGSFGFPLYGLGLNVLDYGIAATVIAHELTHMIDTKTRRYDASGNTAEDWRTEDETKEYDTRTQCFAKSFAEFYSGDINQRPNYENLLKEHVADFVGLEIALKTYRKIADEVGVEKKLGKFKFDHLQLFTIAFAMRSCENSTPEELEWEAKHSPHPPAKFRVDAVLRNTEDFGQIWKCPPGSKMNPLKKCKLWTD